VITDKLLSPIVSELLQLIIQILDTAFLTPPPWGLGTLYDVHLGLTGKCVVDFLLVLTELFSLGVTAKALRTILLPTESPLYDFLLVNNTNLPHILHRFLVMADYWSNFASDTPTQPRFTLTLGEQTDRQPVDITAVCTASSADALYKFYQQASIWSCLVCQSQQDHLPKR